MTQFDVVVFLALLSVGYVYGQYNERRHFRSIAEREQALRELMVFSERQPPPLAGPVDCALVAGSCVVAFDYFRNFVAGIRGHFGGRLTSYETLLERARREALLRMKQEAADIGATMIINVRFESASGASEDPKASGAVEVMVYGTALVPRQSN